MLDLAAMRTLCVAMAPRCGCKTSLKQLCKILHTCTCDPDSPEPKGRVCDHCRGRCDCPRAPVGPLCGHARRGGAVYDRLSEEDWAVLAFRLGVRPVPDGELGTAVWARMLSLVGDAGGAAADYDDPPPPASPAKALSRQSRVSIMEERFAAGVRLHHPGDFWQDAEDLQVGTQSEREMEDEEGVLALVPARLRNGARSVSEALTVRRTA